MTRLRHGRSGVRIPPWSRDFILQNIRTLSEAHSASYSIRTGVLFRRVKRFRPVFDLSPLSSADVKSEWSYKSAPPIRFFGVDWDNFAFICYIRSFQFRGLGWRSG